MTADEVRERIESSWLVLADLVVGMDEPDLTTPNKEGWAVKDHLVHIAAWEHWLLALFEHRDQLAAMGAPSADREIEDINAVIWEMHRADTTDEALRYFRDAHHRLMAVLKDQATMDFERPYRTFFDGGTQDDGGEQPVLVAVAANTYDHYDEHVTWIKEQRGSREPR
jgi:hypothetical protein